MANKIIQIPKLAVGISEQNFQKMATVLETAHQAIKTNATYMKKIKAGLNFQR